MNDNGNHNNSSHNNSDFDEKTLQHEDPTISYQNPNESLELLKLDKYEDDVLPTFNFSSPISSISSDDSFESREYLSIPGDSHSEYDDFSETSDFISLEDLNTQITPPNSAAPSTSKKQRHQLETIHEGVYLDTPPKMTGKSRRKVKVNLNEEEFKENVQTNNI